MGPHGSTGSPTSRGARRRAWVEIGGALLIYLLLASWLTADVLTTADSHLVGLSTRPERSWTLADGDQSMVLANVTSAARSLVSRPWDLWNNGQCHPFPNPRTLGEPMILDGLLAAVPLAVTGEPILAMNLVYLLRILAAGAGMFLLVRHCTGSVGAGFVAGLLFAFEPHRLRDVAHPYVQSSMLAPVAILLAVRLVETLRWGVAIALGAVLGLQAIESFYPAVALGLVGGSCGVGLLIGARGRRGALLARLLVVAAMTLVAVAMVYGPFVETRAVWGVLHGRTSSLLHVPGDFAFGGLAFPGAILLGLAGIGLGDRLWRGHGGVRDLRLPLLVGATLVFWLVVHAVPIPLVGSIPSPYFLGLRALPGFDAVRAVGAIRVGIYLAGAALAGFGVATLVRGRGAGASGLVVIVISALAAGEIFFGGASGKAFGTRYEPNIPRPTAPLLAALRRLPPGPVADVPPGGPIGLVVNSHHLLLSAFHGRPIDTCWNSFVPGVPRDVERLVRALPEPTAIVGLVALGFDGVVLHTEYMAPDRTRAFRDAAAERTASWAAMRELAEADGHVVYAIASDRVRTGPPRVLARRAWPTKPPRPIVVTGPRADVEVPVYNPTTDYFGVERPLAPLRAAFVWRDASERVVSTERKRLLPPLVIPPRRWGHRTVSLAVPPRPGRYTLSVEVKDADPWDLSRVSVEVRTAPAGGHRVGE